MPRKRKSKGDEDESSSGSQYNPDSSQNNGEDSSETWEGEPEEEESSAIESNNASNDDDDDEEVVVVKVKPLAKKKTPTTTTEKDENATTSTTKDDDDDDDGNNNEQQQEQSSSTRNDEENEQREKDGGLTPFRRRKKRKNREWKIDQAELALPTTARKTRNGGYAHTTLSKSRISRANSGNTPWNLGRHRSSADRAKIAAGVRARNRTLLLQKLKKLNMTEEEYLAKRKEISYVRERVRVTKVHNSKLPQDSYVEALKYMSKDQPAEETIIEEEEEEEDDDDDDDVVEEDVRTKHLFKEEIKWKPFSFSKDNPKAKYINVCPTGGPGGLICCEYCSNLYHSYLSQTSSNFEVQRLQLELNEVKELNGYINETKDELESCMTDANAKVPPSIAQRVEESGPATTGKVIIPTKHGNVTQKIYYL